MIAENLSEEYTLTLSAKAITDKIGKVKQEFYRFMTKVITGEPSGGGPDQPCYFSILYDNIGEDEILQLIICNS